MESTNELKDRAETLRVFIERDESATRDQPDNIAYQLSLRSLREHLADISGQIGVALLNGGDLAEAESEFKKAIELKPMTRAILLNSIIMNSDSDWARAIPFLRMLLRIAPTYENARNNLAIAYLNLGVEIAVKGKIEEGTIEEANQLFYLALGTATDQDCIAQISRNLAASHTKLGMYYFRKGEVSRTAVCMRRAREAFPNEISRRNLGLAYAHVALGLMKERHYQDAIAWFENAEDAGVIFPELINDRGFALAVIGRRSEAKLAFQRALELAPKNRRIRENLTLLESRVLNATASFPNLIESDEKEEWPDIINPEQLQSEDFLQEFIPIPPAPSPFVVSAV